MGIKLFGSNSYSSYEHYKPKPPNPDPNNWEILKFLESGRNILIMIQYPDCTNYEGKKILLYLNTTYDDLVTQGSIDPHFSKSKEFRSPFARFEPTRKGWDAGLDTLFRMA